MNYNETEKAEPKRNNYRHETNDVNTCNYNYKMPGIKFLKTLETKWK